MVRLAIRLLKIAAVLVSVWSLLVYGLPAARRAIPGACERWGLSGGFCESGVQQTLAKLEAWVERTLVPLPRHRRVQRGVADVKEAFSRLEALLREQVGDERVNQALRGTDVALRELEGLLGVAGTAREKLADVPENAVALLARARAAFDRLRSLLGSSSRRAEEVSEAVGEAKKALDALSGVLPESPNSSP